MRASRSDGYPNWRTRSSWSSVSIPSITQVMSSVRQRLAIAATTLRPWASFSPAAKPPSTLTASSGKRRRCVRLEKPVPKSSSATRQPSARNRSIVATAWSKLRITAVSVISIVTRRGSIVLASIWAMIASVVAGVAMSMADRLNDRVMSAGSSAAPASALANSTTLSAPIMPNASAAGMNRAGETGPSTGLSQRASASTATTFIAWTSTIGWKCSVISSSGSAVSNAASSTCTPA